MVNKFKLTIVHVACSNKSVHVRGFIAGQKTVENQDWAVGCWAARLPQAAGLGLLGRF